MLSFQPKVTVCFTKICAYSEHVSKTSEGMTVEGREIEQNRRVRDDKDRDASAQL